jgi:hypothetical protein
VQRRSANLLGIGQDDGLNRREIGLVRRDCVPFRQSHGRAERLTGCEISLKYSERRRPTVGRAQIEAIAECLKTRNFADVREMLLLIMANERLRFVLRRGRG